MVGQRQVFLCQFLSSLTTSPVAQKSYSHATAEQYRTDSLARLPVCEQFGTFLSALTQVDMTLVSQRQCQKQRKVHSSGSLLCAFSTEQCLPTLGTGKTFSFG